MIIVLSTPAWIRAMFFATQLLITDGLFFWAALFGLQFHSSAHTGLPVQLVLLAGLLRLAGSLGFVWGLSREAVASELDTIHNRWVQVAKHALIGVPGVLMAVASGHKLDHRRIMMDTKTLLLVLLLAVLPFGVALSLACAKIKNKAGWSLTSLGEHNWRPSWKAEEEMGGGARSGHAAHGHEGAVKKTVRASYCAAAPPPSARYERTLATGLSSLCSHAGRPVCCVLLACFLVSTELRDH
jgi:hypothetical protein